MSVTDSQCLSQTVYVCHRQLLSVTENLCLSEKKYVCHRHYVSVTDSVCISQTVCFSHSSPVFVKIAFSAKNPFWFSLRWCYHSLHHPGPGAWRLLPSKAPDQAQDAESGEDGAEGVPNPRPPSVMERPAPWIKRASSPTKTYSIWNRGWSSFAHSWRRQGEEGLHVTVSN